ncbi:hypothetical protein [Paracoccus fontiphilus]|uniref:Uncharacterized protein n=1 Tax=Paracoccus fontiphilus TaxID=1815556 RepID=A0ABV7IMA5_9RHOB|nr:hypothetical protein [Paracoccus fontiphilus]
MRAALARLLHELATPTTGTGYLWAVIAIGHVMLGAMLQGLLGAAGVGARLAIGIAYWLAKERGDLRRGGSLRDGLADAALVAVGAFYAGPRWWPCLVFAAVCVGAVIREAK